MNQDKEVLDVMVQLWDIKFNKKNLEERKKQSEPKRNETKRERV